MKQLLLIVAATCGLGVLATLKSEASVAVSIGVPIPGPVYVGAPYGPYPYGYYLYPYSDTGAVDIGMATTGATATTISTTTGDTVTSVAIIDGSKSEHKAS